MHKFLYIVFFSFILSLSQASYNPCDDKVYNRILEKELDEMSDREYEYYQKMDKECKEFLRVQKYLEDDNKYIETNMDNVTSVTTNEPELEEKLYALYEGPRFGMTYVSGDLPES